MSTNNSTHASQPSLHNHSAASSELLTTPMATDHPGKNHAKIITQNVQGLRSSEEKLEYITRLMAKKAYKLS
jgi:hypothetical protein